MGGSWKIGRIAGIDLYMHWTFLLLLAWIALVPLLGGQGISLALRNIVLILAIFGCVVLHELGHALMARRFGVPTRDITLLPIGGVARLQRMPEHPLQEFLVAIAGPAVNVVIAGVLFVVLWLMGTPSFALENLNVIAGPMLLSLMWVNVILVVFNMLPAFPMDGGRVLRALLATKINYVKATQIAARVGQAMAFLFGLVGLFEFNPFLLFIALFVYLGAEAEARMVQLRATTAGLSAQDAMMTRFRTLSVDDDLEHAADELLAGAQQDFPVVDNGHHLRGMLRRADLVAALKASNGRRTVGEVIGDGCEAARADESLHAVFTRMQEQGCNSVPVVRGDELVGIVTLENIGELLMIRAAHEEAPEQISEQLVMKGPA